MRERERAGDSETITMTTGIIHDQNLEKHIEKQMGCMAGFFQLFDRHQILTGRRFYSAAKRLASSPPASDSSADSEKSVGSPTVTKEQVTPKQIKWNTATPMAAPRSPAADAAAPAEAPPKVLPIFEFKEGTRSSLKFGKEAPRLSLDSRATVDAKGKLYPKEIRANAAVLVTNPCDYPGTPPDGDEKRRSTSVIAKLMGLEPLPDSTLEPIKQPELRRSASESRVSRDLFQYQFLNGNNFPSFRPHNIVGTKLPNIVNMENAMMENSKSVNSGPLDSMRNSRFGGSNHRPWRSPQQRKSYFDSEDFFPGPKQNMSICGEIERRLKTRGIDEPCKDLETPKQILEVLQLKGLLHSSKRPPSEQIGHRNFANEHRYSIDESPIVLMKPARSRAPHSPLASSITRSGIRRNLIYTSESFPCVSPRREQLEFDQVQARGRNPSSPTRRENNVKSPSSSPSRRRPPLSVETQRRSNDHTDQRRASPVHSPKLSPRRSGSEQTLTNRLPRNRRLTASVGRNEKMAGTMEDDSSSISEYSVGTSSQTDTERSKMEDYRGGRSLLERCDKLLHSIAEMNAAELQPSPVSVLDSAFDKDESSSPSPVMKRSLDSNDQGGELEEEIWSPDFSPIQSQCEDSIEDCDFIYISDVLRACEYFPEDYDMFLLLEKQQFLKGKDASKPSRIQRKLIFDTVTEILQRSRQLPPWKLILRPSSGQEKPSLRQIWSEFQRIRERAPVEEDLFATICGVLRRDLAADAINGWGLCHVEVADVVLDIERLIFKDVVGETIRDLAAFGANCLVSTSRRKLVF